MKAAEAFADIYTPHATAPKPCNYCGEVMTDEERVDLRIHATSQPKSREGKKHLASAGALYHPECARHLYLQLSPLLARKSEGFKERPESPHPETGAVGA